MLRSKISLLLSLAVLFYTCQVNAQITNTQKIQADNLRQAAEEHIRYNMLQAGRGKLEQVLQIYRSLNDKEGERQTLISLAVVYYRQSNYWQAQQQLQQAEFIPAQPQQQGRLWSLKGMLYLETGEYFQALQFLQRAQPFVISDIEENNRLRIALGEAYYYLGWYDRSLSYLELSLRVAGDRNDRGRALNATGDVYFALGQYDRALDFYQQALQVRQAVGDRFGTIRTLNNIGKVKQFSGKIEESVQFYRQALLEANSLNDRKSAVYILNNLGEIYDRLDKKDEALKYFQQALNIDRDKITIARIQTLNNLGKYYRQDNQFDRALESYREAVAWAKKISDRPGEGKALVGMGEVYLQAGETTKALESIVMGVEVLESLRPGLQDEEKVSLFDTQAYAYQIWQKALITAEKSDLALIVAERSRARAFVELLWQRLSSSSPIQGRVNPPTIAEIQAVAKKAKATLVEYSIFYDDAKQESELAIWVIQPTGKIAFRRLNLKLQRRGDLAPTLDAIAEGTRIETATGRRQNLLDLVTRMRGDLTNKAKDLPTITQKGYKLLIEPIADLLPKNPLDRVIFIPQGSLFLIPFHALQTNSGHYLIDRHTISLAPSIQILALAQQSKLKAPSNTALVVGNPYPLPELLDPLVGAETEAKNIAKFLQTEPLLGEKATKNAVIARIAQAPIIHLATHGFFNDRQGLQSSLAFAGRQDTDSFLTAEEILKLPLQAQLAVLSACNTGRGQITGDGVIGLSRSFMSAGVPSVIVSLWYVSDLPTAELMTEFYQNWQQSQDKMSALRQAMLSVRKRYPNPRDWAGFVLLGQPD
jgi:CHAT domain-containing protein/predicted Zn-dependent protease